MTISLARVRAGIFVKQLGTHDLVTSPSIEFPYLDDIEFENGVGDNLANGWWGDQRSLAGSATENLDLSGSLTDIFGASVAPTRIKAMLIEADAANNVANNLVVGGAVSNTWLGFFSDASDKLVFRPGARMIFANPLGTGLAVTAGTGDILLMANSAATNTITYRIAFLYSA
jgi:hypothetical protein